MNHWINHHRFIGARESERPFEAHGKNLFMEICWTSKDEQGQEECYGSVRHLFLDETKLVIVNIYRSILNSSSHSRCL